MTTLETSRLLLRPVQSGDLDDFCALYADPAVMEYIGPPRTREQTADRLKVMIDHWPAHGYGMWAMFLKEGGAFVGRCGVQCVPNRDAPELAYTLHQRFWGQGLATEAARKSLWFAFEVVRLPRLVGVADRANLASRRVLEKLGYAYVRDVVLEGHDALVYERVNTPGQ